MSTPLPGIARLFIGGHADPSLFDYAPLEFLIHVVKGADPAHTMMVTESTLNTGVSKFTRSGQILTYTFNGGVVDFVNSGGSNKVVNTYELYINSAANLTDAVLVSYGTFSNKTIPPAGTWRQTSIELFSLHKPPVFGPADAAIGMSKIVERGLQESAAVAHTGALYHILQYVDPGAGSLITVLRTDTLDEGPGDSGEWFEMVIDPQDQAQVDSGASELIRYLGTDLTWTNAIGDTATLERYILATNNLGTEKISEIVLSGSVANGETVRIEDILIQFNFGA
jgi:hypothetical protein